MNENIKNEISALSTIIKEKINEQLETMSQQELNDKNIADLESFKRDKNNLGKVLEILNDLDNLVKAFSNENQNFSVLLDRIKALPSLDSKSNANTVIMEAFIKDLHNYCAEFLKELNNKTAEMIGEIKQLSKPIYVYYGGQNESSICLRNIYSETVNELISTTIEKLYNLYRKLATNMDNQSMSFQENEFKPKINLDDYESLHDEVGVIDDYVRLYQEKKIDIQPKIKMFFIKQSPRTIIAKARKEAVKKNYAAAVISELGRLHLHQLGDLQSMDYYLYNRHIYRNTIKAEKRIRKKYAKVFFNSESILYYDFNFNRIAVQVGNIHSSEKEEEMQVRKNYEKQYHEYITQAILLGYKLAEAKENGDKELYAKLIEQEKSLNISRDDLVLYENEGVRDFKNKQYACKLFKIAGSEYDALSYETRQNILCYIIPAMTKDQEEIQYDHDYIELQKKINDELTTFGTPSEQVCLGRHM